MTDKHYLSIYYGIDESLPDDIFYREIKLINLQFEEYTERSVFQKYKRELIKRKDKTSLKNGNQW
jgi:hypothetical protein